MGNIELTVERALEELDVEESEPSDEELHPAGDDSSEGGDGRNDLESRGGKSSRGRSSRGRSSMTGETSDEDESDSGSGIDIQEELEALKSELKVDEEEEDDGNDVPVGLGSGMDGLANIYKADHPALKLGIAGTCYF